MCEGHDRIVEEHHAVARDDEIERGSVRRSARRVALHEADIRAAFGPRLRGGDQGLGEIEAGHPRAGRGVGDGEAGGARAAADVEDVEAIERQGASEQRLVQRCERAVGPTPLPGPGLARLSLPFGRSKHLPGLEHRRGEGERHFRVPLAPAAHALLQALRRC